MSPAGTGTPSAGTCLVVAAHPDDIESWCGGTVALMSEQGATVYVLLCTRGDKGSADPHAVPASVAAVREREQREAAEVLGVRGVRFLDHEDGFLEDTPDLRRELVRAIRELRPEVVFTHDPVHPYPAYTVHRDHRVAGRVTLDAVYPAARDRLYFPEHETEGLWPHKVREVWLFSSTEPDAWVDIKATLTKKIAARLKHSSQTPDPSALWNSWEDRAREVGAPVGIGAAEAFKVLLLEA